MKELIIYFQVDDEDADLLEKCYPRLLISYKGKMQNIYNVVANRMGLEAQTIDHIDRRSENNVRSNLRGSTYLQNVHNRGKMKTNKSGYIGVKGLKSKKKQRWVARIKTNGVYYHIGTFDTKEQAAIAYDKKALELRGDWAVLNFPT